MAEFAVKNIISYNTIETQGWKLGEGENRKSGSLVKVRGIPELGNDQFQTERAINRLKITLEGKSVSLKGAKVISDGLIECDVFIDNINVAVYFTDFKSL